MEMARLGDCLRITNYLPSVFPVSPAPRRVTGPVGTANLDHILEAPEVLGRVSISCFFYPF